jgi:hypothetical protein
VHKENLRGGRNGCSAPWFGHLIAGQLTCNNSAGSMVSYNTSLLNAGDLLQMTQPVSASGNNRVDVVTRFQLG